jgi:FtsH-binding integral membrane protein
LTGSVVISLLNIWWRNPLLENLLLVSGVVIYGAYIVYDTQIIIGGKRGINCFINYKYIINMEMVLENN